MQWTRITLSVDMFLSFFNSPMLKLTLTRHFFGFNIDACDWHTQKAGIDCLFACSSLMHDCFDDNCVTPHVAILDSRRKDYVIRVHTSKHIAYHHPMIVQPICWFCWLATNGRKKRYKYMYIIMVYFAMSHH